METLNSVYTPFIGANGNWYVVNEDTGVRAQGEEGPQGPAGLQGLIGPKGNTGDRGPQGVKGDTPELVANLQETVEGKALDATMGKALDRKISDTNDKILLNSDVIFDGRFGGTPGCNLRYNKATKILTINLFLAGNHSADGTKIVTLPADVDAPTDTVKIFAPCVYSDNTMGYVAVHVNPNREVMMYGDHTGMLVNPIVNGSCYIF